MDAGAFSDESVVAAGKGLKFLIVDCTKSAPQDMMTKYNVKGFPTVLFCNYKGEKVEELRGRDAGTVANQFKSVVKKHTVGLPWATDIDKAMEQAKAESKPLLMWVTNTKKKEATTKILEGSFLGEDVQAILKDCVLFKAEFDRKNDLFKKMGVSNGPVLLVLDASAEKPFKPIKRLKKWKSPKKLIKELEKASAKVKKAKL